MENKLFVLIRNDMPLAYQGVQGGHAVAEWMLMHPNTWRNQTLVYLQVPTEDHLQLWYKKIKVRGYEAVKFTEPDLDNHWTAIACMVPANTLSQLKLMGG